MKQHFEQAITDDNCEKLLSVWAEICETGTSENLSLLKELNMPEASISTIKAQLKSDFETQFNQNPALGQFLESSLETGPLSHAERFGGTTDLMGILEKHVAFVAKKATKPTEREARAKLFGGKALLRHQKGPFNNH